MTARSLRREPGLGWCGLSQIRLGFAQVSQPFPPRRRGSGQRALASSVRVSLRCAQDWIPASAGNADQGVRFLSRCFNTNEATLGLVPGVSVDGVEGIDAESPR